MPTVAAGTTDSATLSGASQITFGMDPGERAEYEIRRAGVIVSSGSVSTTRTIGPFASGDVLSVTASRGPVDYAIGSAPSAASGSPLLFADQTELETAVTAERGNIDTAAIWMQGQELRVATEGAAVRLWTLGVDAANSHARVVQLPSGVTLTLGADTSQVRLTSGAPSAGLGANGDAAFDAVSGVAYTKEAGAWSVAAQPPAPQLKTINGNSLLGTGDLTVGGGGGGGGATNLSYTAGASGGTVVSDTGSDAALPLSDGTVAGLLSPAQHAKLAGIGAGANVTSVAGRTGVVTLAKADVGLANVDNTADANKPISAATQAALDAKQATLVSGTSIKTINGNSLLGSGDIAISGGGGAATNITVTANAADLTIGSSSGSAGTFPGATSSLAGAFLPAEKTKLAGIATGATANATDAQLRDRSTHTGTQPAATISGLAAVATAGTYASLSGLPTLGTAAAADTTAFLPAGFPVAVVQASEALAAGDWVHVWSDGGAFRVREANGNSAGRPADGYVLTAVSSGANATVYFSGTNTQVTAQTPGPVYLQTTAGLGGPEAPSAPGNVVQRIGVAVSATAVVFSRGIAVTRT